MSGYANIFSKESYVACAAVPLQSDCFFPGRTCHTSIILNCQLLPSLFLSLTVHALLISRMAVVFVATNLFHVFRHLRLGYDELGSS